MTDKQKWVLIKPDYKADVEFFCEMSGERPTNTPLLSEAHIFEHDAETMQYILDRMVYFDTYSAIPVEGVDIFKAKLKGV